MFNQNPQSQPVAVVTRARRGVDKPSANGAYLYAQEYLATNNTRSSNDRD